MPAMDSDQRRNAQILINTGFSFHANRLVLMVLMDIGWGENNMHTYGCTQAYNGQYCGLFQVSESDAARHTPYDTQYWCTVALQSGLWTYGGIISNALQNPNASPGYLANLCQGAYSNLDEGANYYNQYNGISADTLSELAPGVPVGGLNPQTGALPEGPYESASVIREATWVLGVHGQRAYDNANDIQRYVDGTHVVTFDGPQ